MCCKNKVRLIVSNRNTLDHIRYRDGGAEQGNELHARPFPTGMPLPVPAAYLMEESSEE